MPIESIAFNKEAHDLLAAAGLPMADLADSGNGPQLFGYLEKGRLIGVVGIEALGLVGLLRSLAVHEDYQNCGRGRSLVAHAETWAVQKDIQRLYLLTISAADFFAKLGYTILTRAEAPKAIAATTQFAGLCPASSTFMVKDLCCS
jgi:amino-acid N-acetyltransferase